MIQDEIGIVRQLTGAEGNSIQLSDDGFLSRGYVVDGGRMVFKFKRSPDVSYKNEIRILNYINTLNLGINLQRVGWKPEDDSYLGLYGILGQPLTKLNMTPAQKQDAGRQLGLFLKKLHAAKPEGGIVFGLEDEIRAWGERFILGKPVLEKYFSAEELWRISEFILREAPDELRALGENLVFSHSDLGDGNILVDDSGRIGVIDFNSAGLLDEAADFMDIGDDGLLEEMLLYYGANETLRKKVSLRRSLRPMFVIGTYAYARRGEAAVRKCIQKIQMWLNSCRLS